MLAHYNCAIALAFLLCFLWKSSPHHFCGFAHAQSITRISTYSHSGPCGCCAQTYNLSSKHSGEGAWGGCPLKLLKWLCFTIVQLLCSFWSFWLFFWRETKEWLGLANHITELHSVGTAMDCNDSTHLVCKPLCQCLPMFAGIEIRSLQLFSPGHLNRRKPSLTVVVIFVFVLLWQLKMSASASGIGFVVSCCQIHPELNLFVTSCHIYLRELLWGCCSGILFQCLIWRETSIAMPDLCFSPVTCTHFGKIYTVTCQTVI